MQHDRYLADFDSDKLQKIYSDVIVIGSGTVGLYAALAFDKKYKVNILTKETVPENIADLPAQSTVVYLNPIENEETYIRDTIYSGCGLCDEKAVRALVKHSPVVIEKLAKMGVLIKPGENNQGEIKERTYKISETENSVRKTLLRNAATSENISIESNSFVVDLLVDSGKCHGVLVYNEEKKEHLIYFATIIICASGGYGSMYKNTVKPDINTGDGVALAFRAGAAVRDLEFVKFHPTVLYTENNKNLVISEKLRKEGGYIVNSEGKRFLFEYSDLGENANADVIARGITSELRRSGEECVYVDVRHKDKTFMLAAFPEAYNACLKQGIDMSKDLIPVVPAEQYCIGGIKANRRGATTIENFYVCGEAACNGVHGANRLARNTLIDGVVFADLISNNVTPILEGEKPVHPHFAFAAEREKARSEEAVKADIAALKSVMTRFVGVLRNDEGLFKALRKVMEISDRELPCANASIYDYILKNDLMLAEVIIVSAIERRESRGAHFRTDFPRQNDVRWRKNITRRFY